MGSGLGGWAGGQPKPPPGAGTGGGGGIRSGAASRLRKPARSAFLSSWIHLHEHTATSWECGRQGWQGCNALP